MLDALDATWTEEMYMSGAATCVAASEADASRSIGTGACNAALELTGKCWSETARANRISGYGAVPMPRIAIRRLPERVGNGSVADFRGP